MCIFCGTYPMANSVDVARELLLLAKKEDKSLTNMQLQKMVYIAHGIHLAYHDAALLDEEVNAWKHGPVIPQVYYAFKQYLNKDIDVDSEAGSDYDFTKNQMDSISSTYEIFKNFDGWALREATHKQGSPWYEIWYDKKGKETFNAVIPNEVIKSHYLKIKAAGEATAL